SSLLEKTEPSRLLPRLFSLSDPFQLPDPHRPFLIVEALGVFDVQVITQLRIRFPDVFPGPYPGGL
ncbi:MAG: hypothetical protein MJ000_11965, partial [Bacteroidales bacterium]|nr:hypothetical protein [Bacteroidales bacterium]